MCNSKQGCILPDTQWLADPRWGAVVVALAAMVGSAPNELCLLGVGQGGRYVLPATGHWPQGPRPDCRHTSEPAGYEFYRLDQFCWGFGRVWLSFWGLLCLAEVKEDLHSTQIAEVLQG